MVENLKPITSPLNTSSNQKQEIPNHLQLASKDGNFDCNNTTLDSCIIHAGSRNLSHPLSRLVSQQLPSKCENCIDTSTFLLNTYLVLVHRTSSPRAIDTEEIR